MNCVSKASRLCQMVVANCIWMFGEMSVYPPRYHKSFCLCIQSRRALLNEGISHAEWVPEWVGGGKRLSPFFSLFLSFLLWCGNLWEHFKLESPWEMTSYAPNAPLSKYTWKIFFTSLCPICVNKSYLHFPRPEESAKNTDKCHLDWGPPMTQSRIVSSH